MNGNFFIFSDAAFNDGESKSAYGMAVYFDSSLLIATLVEEKQASHKGSISVCDPLHLRES